jgi:hypothetical protein
MRNAILITALFAEMVAVVGVGGDSPRLILVALLAAVILLLHAILNVATEILEQLKQKQCCANEDGPKLGPVIPVKVDEVV